MKGSPPAHNNKSVFLIVLISIAILVSVIPAYSVRVSSTEVQQKVGWTSAISEPSRVQSANGDSLGSSFATIASGGGSRVIERQYFQPGEPVKIKKQIFPLKDEGYLLGNSIIVYVEIIPLLKEIKNLWVHELIDESLNLSNNGYISDVYKVISASQIKACRDAACKNLSRVDVSGIACLENSSINTYGNLNNMRTFGNIHLNKFERLIYWYSIRPTRAGIYSTETQLRFYDNGIFYPDIDYSLNLVVSDPEPKFEVGATAVQNNVPKYTKLNYSFPFFRSPVPLNVTYDITYLGGAGDEISVKIELDKKEHYKYINQTKEGFEIDTNTAFTSLLKKNSTRYFSKEIIYLDEGVFSLPTISIDEKRNYFKTNEIVVDTWWQRNKDYLFLGIGFLGFIFGDAISEYVERLLRRKKEETKRCPLCPDEATRTDKLEQDDEDQ